MGLKEWKQKRKEHKEQSKRMGLLNDEELGKLRESEKQSYFGIAQKQVRLRGKINAYKDFPIDNPNGIKLDDDEDLKEGEYKVEEVEVENEQVEEENIRNDFQERNVMQPQQMNRGIY